jgi:hypothetical protein
MGRAVVFVHSQGLAPPPPLGVEPPLRQGIAQTPFLSHAHAQTHFSGAEVLAYARRNTARVCGESLETL